MEQSNDKIPIRKRTNMSPTPELGPRFGINQMAGRGETIRRPGEVPPVRRSVTETTPPPGRRSIKDRLGKHPVLKTTLAGAAALSAVAFAADQTIPAVHEGIEKAKFNSLVWGITQLEEKGPAIQEKIDEITGKTPPVSETFDNKVINTGVVVQAGINAISVTKEDLNAFSNEDIKPPSGNNPYPTIQLLFPGMLQDGDKVDIEKRGGVIRSIDMSTGKEVVDPYRESGFKFTFPRKGTQLISGVLDSQTKTIEVFKLPQYLVNGTPYFNGVLIKVTRDDGSIYTISVGSPKDVRYLQPLSVLDDAPQLEKGIVKEGNSSWVRFRNLDGQPGKIISETTPIMKTGLAYAEVGYTIGGGAISGDKAITTFSGINLVVNSSNQLIFIPQPTS